MSEDDDKNKRSDSLTSEVVHKSNFIPAGQ